MNFVGKEIKDGMLMMWKDGNGETSSTRNRNWNGDGSMDYLLGDTCFYVRKVTSGNYRTYNNNGENWLIYKEDLIPYDGNLMEELRLKKEKEEEKTKKYMEELKKMNLKMETKEQGAFNNIFIGGNAVKTTLDKVAYFTEAFKSGIKLANNQEVTKIEMFDDLTFKFEVETTKETKAELVKEELNKLELQSDFVSENFELIKDALLKQDGILTVEQVKELKLSLIKSLGCKIDNIINLIDEYRTHSERIIEVFKIREQEGKVFRFINRSVIKSYKKITQTILNHKDLYNADLSSEMVNITSDINKITNATNVKKQGIYYLTFDSNKVIQCSSNTGDKWRSCYKLDDGEYRNSAIYCASHKRIGMVYSLTSEGHIKERRFIVVDKDAVYFAKWYPKTPKGLEINVENVVVDLLGLKGYDTRKEVTINYSSRNAKINLNDKNIYFDFENYGKTYFESQKGLDAIKNTYNDSSNNELMQLLQVGYRINLEDKDGKNKYYEMRD